MHPKTLAALFALTLSPAALAGEYGGGGLILGDAYIANTDFTWAGSSASSAPGEIECVGGVGFGVNNSRVRSGGDGMYCHGNGFSMAYGGFISGHDVDLGPLYGSAYTSVGFGWMGVANPEYQSEDFRVLDHGMIYARPTVALGIPVGWAALELSVYAFGNLSFAQQASGGPLWSTPHFGSQLSILFGSFSERRSWDDDWEDDDDWDDDQGLEDGHEHEGGDCYWGCQI